MTRRYLFVLEDYNQSRSYPIFIGTQEEFDIGMKDGPLARSVQGHLDVMLVGKTEVEAKRHEIHANGTVEFSADDWWRANCGEHHEYCWKKE